MPKINIEDASLLSAALEGLELQKSRIEDQIRNVRAALGKGGGGGSSKPAASSESSAKPSRAIRDLSPAARARIAAAQKKRWAEYRKQKAAQAQ